MRREAYLALLLAVTLGCSREEVARASTATPAPSTTAPATEPIGQGPCRLLTSSDVERIFAGAGNGRLDRSLEKTGLLRCEWRHRADLLVVLESTEEVDEPVMEEARGTVIAFLDPLSSSADRYVRYEKLVGVGDEAIAVVEPVDKAKGIVTDGALLVVRRGKRTITVLSTGLTQRDRSEALKLLSDLGRAIARRLE
jgi:hypothetical protein